MLVESQELAGRSRADIDAKTLGHAERQDPAKQRIKKKMHKNQRKQEPKCTLKNTLNIYL